MLYKCTLELLPREVLSTLCSFFKPSLCCAYHGNASIAWWMRHEYSSTGVQTQLAKWVIVKGSSGHSVTGDSRM